MLKYVIQPEMYMAELYKLYHFSGNIQHADGSDVGSMGNNNDEAGDY